MDSKDDAGDHLYKNKVIRTLRTDRSHTKTVAKRQKIDNLRSVCNKILEFCEKQDASPPKQGNKSPTIKQKQKTKQGLASTAMNNATLTVYQTAKEIYKERAGGNEKSAPIKRNTTKTKKTLESNATKLGVTMVSHPKKKKKGGASTPSDGEASTKSGGGSVKSKRIGKKSKKAINKLTTIDEDKPALFQEKPKLTNDLNTAVPKVNKPARPIPNAK